MRLYTYRGSANAYKVELLLALLDRPCERVELSIFDGEARTPAFLIKNPAGGVPVLELDDGTCLPQSNAILWHLARGTRFMPGSALAQDRALAWLMFEQSDIEPVIGSARFWILTGRDRERADETKRRLAWGAQSLAALDRVLAGSPFLLEEPSVADLAIYAYTHLAPEAGLALPPNVAAWCARVEALPGFLRRTIAYDPKAMV